VRVAGDAGSGTESLDRRFEIWEAVLLAAATVMVAWAGFQSAKWNGDQADLTSQASATQVESTRASTLAGQQTVIDVNSFTAWLNALAEERRADPSASQAPDGSYAADPSQLSGFLFARLRPEFKTATEAWLRLRPLENAHAPPTPFAMKEYRLAATVRANHLERRADELSGRARGANRRSDEYVLVTILFASVLFFAGISSKMDTRRARLLLLGAGVIVFVVSTVVVLSFPKEF
jgi:hypothetical protein